MHALTATWATWEGCGSVSGVATFPEAVGAHDPVLLAMARRLCGNDADARDLVHDTYEKALRAQASYSDSGNLKSWLLTIMHHIFIDQCRKARRAPRTESIENVDIAASDPAAPPAWSNVTAEQVVHALDQIGAEFRMVYELHSAGCSYDAIATRLKIPKATVGTRLVRARKKLKEVLARDLSADLGEPR